MILLFLRLFPEFFSLEVQLQESANARLRAEDQTRLWQAKCEAAETLRDEALKEKERNHKMICNWMALYYGSPNVPFPEEFVHVKREEPEQEPQPKRRHAADVAREFDREFREQFGRSADAEFDSFNQSQG